MHAHTNTSTHSVGLLLRSDQLVAGDATYTIQNRNNGLKFMPPEGFETAIAAVSKASDFLFKLHDRRDWQNILVLVITKRVHNAEVPHY